jgi:hypothetical protein
MPRQAIDVKPSSALSNQQTLTKKVVVQHSGQMFKTAFGARGWKRQAISFAHRS